MRTIVRHKCFHLLKNGNVFFQIQPNDTLAGIAIKYGLNTEDIKKANLLYYDSDLISHTYLKIPTNGAVYEPK